MRIMKSIGFWECKPEDFAKIIPMFREAIDARKTAPNKFPKIIYETSFMSVSGSSQWKGFSIYEDPTEEQLNNMIIHYHPLITFQFMQLTSAEKFIPQFLKMKK